MEFPCANKQPDEGGTTEETEWIRIDCPVQINLSEMRRSFTCRVCSQIVQRPMLKVLLLSSRSFPTEYCIFLGANTHVSLCKQCLGKNGDEHIACGGCVAKLPGGQYCPCGGVYKQGAASIVADGIRWNCFNDGCDMFGGYLDHVEHERACPHGPKEP